MDTHVQQTEKEKEWHRTKAKEPSGKSGHKDFGDGLMRMFLCANRRIKEPMDQREPFVCESLQLRILSDDQNTGHFEMPTAKMNRVGLLELDGVEEISSSTVEVPYDHVSIF